MPPWDSGGLFFSWVGTIAFPIFALWLATAYPWVAALVLLLVLLKVGHNIRSTMLADAAWERAKRCGR